MTSTIHLQIKEQNVKSSIAQGYWVREVTFISSE